MTVSTLAFEYFESNFLIVLVQGFPQFVQLWLQSVQFLFEFERELFVQLWLVIGRFFVRI